MGSLQWALSWLVVGAVGLAPILVYWAAGVIGRAFRRKRGGPRTGNAPVQPRGEGNRPPGRLRGVSRQYNSDPALGLRREAAKGCARKRGNFSKSSSNLMQKVGSLMCS
jgi:hypothetical protein